MKHLFLTLLTLGYFQTTHAGLTLPYKTVEINCENANGTLKLLWDFSKSPMVNEILVNGKSELAGSQISVENGATIYSKDHVFLIALTQEDDKKLVTKEVMLMGKNEIMLCAQSTDWRITD